MEEEIAHGEHQYLGTLYLLAVPYGLLFKSRSFSDPIRHALFSK